MTDRRNLRKLRAVVTAQTLNNLLKLADMHGWGPNDVGRVIDKLVRDRMVYLHKRGGMENGKATKKLDREEIW